MGKYVYVVYMKYWNNDNYREDIIHGEKCYLSADNAQKEADKLNERRIVEAKKAYDSNTKRTLVQREERDALVKAGLRKPIDGGWPDIKPFSPEQHEDFYVDKWEIEDG